jgi:hypothetical protein
MFQMFVNFVSLFLAMLPAIQASRPHIVFILADDVVSILLFCISSSNVGDYKQYCCVGCDAV